MGINTLNTMVLFILLTAASCSAFNITKMLRQYPEFGLFNQYLSETKIADQINARSTITVLVVSNTSLGRGLSSGDDSTTKSVLSAHVILDYFDKEKLTGMARSNKIAMLATLFQATGEAQDRQGFIKVGNVNGDMSFGSAQKGGQMNSKLVKSVTAQPFNISVLQVSSVIGIPNINASPAPERAPAPAPKKKDDDADSPSDDTVESPADDTSDNSEAPSPSESDSTPPKPADDDMAPSPSESPADSPDTTPPSKSDTHATSVERATIGIVTGFISVLVALC